MNDTTQAAAEDIDFENMSDDDFMGHTPPEGGSVDLVGEENPAQEGTVQTDVSEEAGQAADEGALAGADDSAIIAQAPEAGAKPEEGGAQPTDAAAVAPAEGETTPHQPTPAEAEAPNYEALYKQVMAPFKANGKEFVPSSPEELVRLAQMGANYTKKMQALTPNLKLMRMLENNGLLDESKISFLIDIEKKDPKAIQKLLHDSKLDPLDLDASAEPAYVPGNHTVSDQEMQFREVLDEVSSTDSGKGTILLINNKWDQVSKQAVFQEPRLLAIINEQRSNGIYDQIVSEIERQQTLGHLTGMPFIQAYKAVGDRLHSEGKFASKPASPAAVAITGAADKPRQVLETRPAAAKPSVSNGTQARAASPGPRTPAKTSSSFDPFSMTDEQIMAISSPRI